MKPSTLLLTCLMMAFDSNQSEAPHWENLECEKGSKYLFSDFVADWPEAFAECELYGGWLTNIRSISEQNCLLRHASTQNYDSWYWTGAHVEETPGVFVNSREGADALTWFYPKWTCGSIDDGHGHYNTIFGGGDALLLYLGGNPLAGAWCDWYTDRKFYFICEGPL